MLSYNGGCLMNEHHIKCFKPRFELLATGDITADVRFNDRDYKKWDIIVFKEGEPCSFEGFKFTGRSLRAIISNVDTYGVQPGFVALSLKFTEKLC